MQKITSANPLTQTSIYEKESLAPSHEMSAISEIANSSIFCGPPFYLDFDSHEVDYPPPPPLQGPVPYDLPPELCQRYWPPPHLRPPQRISLYESFSQGIPKEAHIDVTNTINSNDFSTRFSSQKKQWETELAKILPKEAPNFIRIYHFLVAAYHHVRRAYRENMPRTPEYMCFSLQRQLTRYEWDFKLVHKKIKTLIEEMPKKDFMIPLKTPNKKPKNLGKTFVSLPPSSFASNSSAQVGVKRTPPSDPSDNQPAKRLKLSDPEQDQS